MKDLPSMSKFNISNFDLRSLRICSNTMRKFDLGIRRFGTMTLVFDVEICHLCLNEYEIYAPGSYETAVFSRDRAGPLSQNFEFSFPTVKLPVSVPFMFGPDLKFLSRS